MKSTRYTAKREDLAQQLILPLGRLPFDAILVSINESSFIDQEKDLMKRNFEHSFNNKLSHLKS